MSIFITGSLAYDRVMNFPGTFGDYIIPDKIHMLNVCFPIGNLEEKRGGTGGNIAYNLAMLGEKSRILTSVGKDFGSYKFYLEKIGVNLDGLNIAGNEFTAGAYITTDKHANQITGFHAAAMTIPCAYKFPALSAAEDIGIIAPTNTTDMTSHAAYYRENGIRFIFDPGQQITSLSGEELICGITGAMLLISNDYELELICKLTGLDLEGILKLTPVVITTLGEKGSRIVRRGGGESMVPAMPINSLENPTGAGDSYRAGLIKGILNSLSLEESAAIGAACAAFCVEKYGTQEHYYDAASLGAKYKAGTGKELPISFTPLVQQQN
ncbi:carbohydrate kinase family protein [Desulfovibrio sp. OttesenSCG-928-C06]|nr:carbohydrate kinase family protein [Desulfovibrio sp. OttesenSCG-928-C06]